MTLITLPNKINSMGITPAPQPQSVTVAGFEYMGVDPELIEDIELHVTSFLKREQQWHKTGIEHAVEQGNLLIEAKELLKHGNFTKWVEDRLCVSDQTARNYMYAANTYSGKTQMILDLPMGVAYRIAAPSTPPEVKQKALALLQNGKKMTLSEVVNEIKIAKEKEKIAKEKQQAAELEDKAHKTLYFGKPAKIVAEIAAIKEKHKAKLAAKAEAEMKTNQQAADKAASDALALITLALGDQLPTFAALYKQASGQFDKALSDAMKGAVS